MGSKVFGSERIGIEMVGLEGEVGEVVIEVESVGGGRGNDEVICIEPETL